MSSVHLLSVSKSFAKGSHAVLDALDLSVRNGEFVVLLGPSGCGKTTLLRMIAGFVTPSAGRILFDDRDVTHQPARSRRVGIVFQNYALFPNMTVEENIAFGPRQRGVRAPEVNARVHELLEMVQLTGRRRHYPHQLSGGQQQRVALARALAHSPRVLLMDEPLAALDVQLRETMQIELRRIQRELGITTILVTHDQHEAMSLADRIVIMAEGTIQQVGSPQQLYQFPRSRFVSEFMGKNNLINADIERVDGRLCLRVGQTLLPFAPSVDGRTVGSAMLVAIRPHDIDISAHSEDGAGLAATIAERRFLGNVVQYDLRTSWEQTLLVESSARCVPFDVSQRVLFSWRPDAAALIDQVASAGMIKQ